MSRDSTTRLRQLAEAIDGALGGEDDQIVAEWTTELRTLADGIDERLDDLTAVGAGALDMVASAPWPENRRTFAARIPWDYVERTRADLEASGVDWRKFKRDKEDRMRAGKGMP